VSEDNVYRVCDQPHPLKVRGIVEACAAHDVEKALAGVMELWQQGAWRARSSGTLGARSR
jgi:replication factor C subunit 2/4